MTAPGLLLLATALEVAARILRRVAAGDPVGAATEAAGAPILAELERLSREAERAGADLEATLRELPEVER